MGSINDFDLKYPEEPHFEDIGKAKIHLEKDYPEIWGSKEKAYTTSVKHLDIIKGIIIKFNEKVKEIIEKNSDFKEYSDKFKKLSENKYYYPEIGLEVFRDMRNNMNEVQFDDEIIFNNSQKYVILKFMSSDTKLFQYKFDDNTTNTIHNEAIEIIKKLKENSCLIKLVEDYKKEFDSFFDNEDRNNFFKSIDDLYNNIVNENAKMNQKGMCGSKNCITRFTRIRSFLPE